MAAANFSRDGAIHQEYLNVVDFNRMKDGIEGHFTTRADLKDYHEYISKTRDFREFVSTNAGDLIDFETVLENPLLSMEWNHVLGVYQTLRKQKLHNHCDWLKIGKNERCGKRCKQFYCSTHSEYINKGGIIPLPCLCCGYGVRKQNQLCRLCEWTYRVEYK